MTKNYSVCEAKARFSEILRRVREQGESVTVSYRGEPVAEIRPLRAAKEEAFGARLRRLEERGCIVRPGPAPVEPHPIARKPGALERFLKHRER